jgi:hypothetical protein
MAVQLAGPGGITGRNDDAAFRVAVPLDSAGYVYDRIELTRITSLAARFSWVARIVGQIANGNLQYSEQLGAGGPTSVRGYSGSSKLRRAPKTVAHSRISASPPGLSLHCNIEKAVNRTAISGKFGIYLRYFRSETRQRG